MTGGPTGPVVLVVLDGWGLSERKDYNAVALAATPNYDALRRRFPNSQLQTSGQNVGLPDGTMGVSQQLLQIDQTINEGSLERNTVLRRCMELARSRGSRLHLFGLISQAVVHSSEKHYLALIALAAQAGVEPDKVFFHAFTDGRDSPPFSAEGAMYRLEAQLQKCGGRVATVIGRYYAMDRDKRWARTQLAYEAMVLGRGKWKAGSGREAIELAYSRASQHLVDSPFPAESDEFIRPTVITDSNGPVGTICNHDIVISFNHRADRARQIIRTLWEEDSAPHQRFLPHSSFTPQNRPVIHLTTLTDYRAGFDCPVAFDSNLLTGTIGEVVSMAGLRQFHAAETEKYPHVTFFFNGGRESPFEGEDRYMVPSPEVATYDQKPEMSAAEITTGVVEAIRSKQYDLVIINYANADMVGHTGVLEASIRAVEAVDQGIGEIVRNVLEMDGEALITADHGNCEQMWDQERNSPHTAHTNNPVPCILVSKRYRDSCLGNGRLADVAPTLLALLGLKCPGEMDGEILVRVAHPEPERPFS